MSAVIFFCGWIAGCLTVLSIASLPRKVPRPFVVGSDCSVPRSLTKATVVRRGAWKP